MKFVIIVGFAVMAYQEPITAKENCPALIIASAPACASLEASACGTLAQEVRQGHFVGTFLEAAKPLYEDACQKGHAPSCVWAAELQLSTAYCRAQQLFLRACDLDDYVSCVQAGDMLSGGSPDGQVPPDQTRSATLYEKACIGGYDRACAVFADVLELGEGVARDEKKAAETRARAKKLSYHEE